MSAALDRRRTKWLQHRDYHRRLPPLLLLPILFLSSILTVAQSTSTRTSIPSSIRASPSTPNFSTAPHLIALSIFIFTQPFYMFCFYFLFKRRHMYPIAGRSSILLLSLSALAISLNLCAVFLGLAYSNGLPCSFVILLNYLHAMPCAIIYTLRAWILVFRIEIMNYLDEKRWREERRVLKKEMKEKAMKAVMNNQMQGHVATTAMTTRINVLPPLIEEEEMLASQRAAAGGSSETKFVTISPIATPQLPIASDDDDGDSSIPGFWFITHRQYISWTFLIRVISVIVLILSTFTTLILIQDPDLDQAEDELHASGELAPTESIRDEQLFGKITFLNTPECPRYSIKLWLMIGMIFLVAWPIVTWCSWRIYSDMKRRWKRQEEKLMMSGEQLISSSSSSAASPSSLSTSDQDDMPSVKQELFRIILLTLTTVLLTIPIKRYASEYMYLLFYYIAAGIVYISILNPLSISFTLSRQLRERLGGGRNDGGGNTSIGGNSRTGEERVRIPVHHRRYYSLDYILTNSQCYSILLSFLQKEHSSENILFLSAAQRFTTAARLLETAMCWSAETDGDTQADEAMVTPGGANRAVSLDFLNGSSSPPPLPRSSSSNVPNGRQRLPSLNMSRGRSKSSMEVIPNVPILMRTPSIGAGGMAAASSSMTSSTSISQQQLDTSNPSALIAEAIRLKSIIQQIQHEYFDKSAVYEVNLPQSVLKIIVRRNKQFAEWDPTEFFSPPPFPLSSLYREVYTEVYRLIESDSFRRFVLTPAFESILRRADDAEVCAKERQNDLVVDTEKLVEHAVSTLASVRGASMQDLNAAAAGSILSPSSRPRSSTDSGDIIGGGERPPSVQHQHMHAPLLDRIPTYIDSEEEDDDEEQEPAPQSESGGDQQQQQPQSKRTRRHIPQHSLQFSSRSMPQSPRDMRAQSFDE